MATAASAFDHLPAQARSSERFGLFFLLVMINLVLAFIRPQEYMASLRGQPIIPTGLVLCFLTWMASKKNLEGPMGTLVVMFLLITTFTHIANGWFGGAAAWFPEFLLTCAMFYFLAAASTSTRKVRRLMFVFSACGIVMVVHSIQQSIYGQAWTGEVPVAGRVRYIGILNDPNDLGLFLVMGLPFMILFLTEARGGIRKLFWLTAIGSYFYTFYLTQSRGTMVAAAVVIALMSARRFGNVFSGMVVAALLAGATLLPSRMTQINASEASAYTRVEAWFHGLQMFETNVLFGVGAGRFTDYHVRTAHNTLLLVIAETGLSGMCVFIALFGYAYLMMREAGFRRKPPDPEAPDGDFLAEKATSRALFYSLIGFMAAGFFLSRSYVIFPYVLLGMISGYYAYLRTKDPSLRGFRLSADIIKWMVLSVVIVLALYVMVRALL